MCIDCIKHFLSGMDLIHHKFSLEGMDLEFIKTLRMDVCTTTGPPALFGTSQCPTAFFFLSTSYPSDQTIDGVTYNCVEQFYNVSRARLAGRKDLEDEIMSLEPSYNSTKLMRDLGREALNNRPELWNQWDYMCLRVMFRGVVAKFTQNPDLQTELCLTGSQPLAAATYDPRWGTGVHWSDSNAEDMDYWHGHNLLGLILMFTRDNIY